MRTALVLAALGFAASCTPPSPAADAGADSGTFLDDACAQDATSQCHTLDACLNDAGVSARYHDLFTCQSRLKGACLVASTAPNTGRTADGVLACATARATETCSDFFDNTPPAACQTPAGSLPSGSVCAFSAQCASTFCAMPRGAACGACATVPAAGADCTATGQCGTGQVCASQVLSAPGTSRCVTPGKSGASCDRESPCASGFGCVAPKVDGGVGPGTCAALGGAIGAPCDPLSRTQASCDLDKGLFCDTGLRTCQPATYAGPGSPCGTLDGGTERTLCALASTCEGVVKGVGTCLERALDGTTCDSAAGPSCIPPARCITLDGGTAGLCRLPTPNCD